VLQSEDGREGKRTKRNKKFKGPCQRPAPSVPQNCGEVSVVSYSNTRLGVIDAAIVMEPREYLWKGNFTWYPEEI
jgi:hypothetical protein